MLSYEQLILKAIILQNQSVSYLQHANRKTPRNESEKKNCYYYFFSKSLLGDYSHPQQAALGLFATIVAHSSVRVKAGGCS